MQSVHELGDDIDGKSILSKLVLLILHFPKLRLGGYPRGGGGRRQEVRLGGSPGGKPQPPTARRPKTSPRVAVLFMLLFSSSSGSVSRWGGQRHIAYLLHHQHSRL